MNKKLMAVAVAGALAAPALALAQTATVNIYGQINAEYGFARQPDDAVGVGRQNVDALNSGASRIGFRGEERLGGNLSAWFQCESDLRFLAGTSTLSTTPMTSGGVSGSGPNGARAGALCDRNSALGLKGGFGNFFVGTWDTPIKQTIAKTRMLNETGWVGVQHLLAGTGGLSVTFSTRASDSINYESPNFGGFSIRAQTSSINAAKNVGSTVAANAKGRAMGIAADYTNGPLVVAVGYERLDDNRSVTYDPLFPAATNGKDTAWAVGATYTFGAFKGGLTWTDYKVDDGTGFTIKKSAWNVALQYQLGGPGSILAGFTKANDFKCTGCPGDDGADMWQIGYNHALSKRTSVGVTYARLKNDRLGTYNLTGLNAPGAGVESAKASVINLQMIHSF